MKGFDKAIRKFKRYSDKVVDHLTKKGYQQGFYWSTLMDGFANNVPPSVMAKAIIKSNAGMK